MLSGADSPSTFSCAVLRFVTDSRRNLDVPAGVALWAEGDEEIRFRFPRKGERIDTLSTEEVLQHLEAVRAQLNAWLDQRQLPYAPPGLLPLSAEWWEHAGRLLRFRVRLGPARSIDCRVPDEEIETLFEALVQPQVKRRQQIERVDGAVSRALGDHLARRLRPRQEVPGYGGKPVRVLRTTSDAHRIVIVEAVSLAARTATQDADALASRLQRARESDDTREIRYVLGYLTSPEGLNGEKAMKEWIEHKIGVRMYDLIRERGQFHDEAARCLADVDDSLGLFVEEVAVE
jgi:hypothetical protein